MIRDQARLPAHTPRWNPVIGAGIGAPISTAPAATSHSTLETNHIIINRAPLGSDVTSRHSEDFAVG